MSNGSNPLPSRSPADRATPERVYLGTGLAQGVLFAGWAVAAVPWWVVVLQLSPIELILLGTALEGTVLLAEIPTGVVADVFSRKWSVVASWAVIGIAQFLGPVSEIFGLLMIWQVLWAIGFTLQSGADTAWVTDETGEPDDRLIMRHAIARSVGIVIGVLAAFATLQISITATMQIFGIASLAFAGLLAIAMQETNFTPIDRSERSTWSAFGETLRIGWDLSRKVSALRIMAIATLFFAMADQAIDRLDIRRLVDLGFPDIGGEDAVIGFGLIWIVMTVLNIPVMVIADRRASDLDTAATARLLRLMLLAASAGITAMALGVSFVLAVIGWIVRDVAREVIEPLAVAWTNRHAPSEARATVLSFRSQGAALGEVTGGLLAGAIATFVSLAAAFAMAALLLALAAAQFLAAEKPEQQTRLRQARH